MEIRKLRLIQGVNPWEVQGTEHGDISHQIIAERINIIRYRVTNENKKIKSCICDDGHNPTVRMNRYVRRMISTLIISQEERTSLDLIRWSISRLRQGRE